MNDCMTEKPSPERSSSGAVLNSYVDNSFRQQPYCQLDIPLFMPVTVNDGIRYRLGHGCADIGKLLNSRVSLYQK